mgnify:CR=1 FL=1|tara:strand:+ start:4130 stop:4321 length:192 start_codon:yes stop_codon:yes gene_type:complete
MIVVGFYLLMVSILPDGTVTGQVLDYFDDPYECVQMGMIEESISPPGIGYVCVEDYVEVGEGI